MQLGDGQKNISGCMPTPRFLDALKWRTDSVDHQLMIITCSSQTSQPRGQVSSPISVLGTHSTISVFGKVTNTRSRQDIGIHDDTNVVFSCQWTRFSHLAISTHCIEHGSGLIAARPLIQDALDAIWHFGKSGEVLTHWEIGISDSSFTKARFGVLEYHDRGIYSRFLKRVFKVANGAMEKPIKAKM